MEPAWRQQGRGRGRGHDAQGQRSRPLPKERERPGGAPEHPQAGQPVPSRFEEIRKSNQAAAKRLVESHLSSSSSDEDQDGTDDGDTQRGRILESTFTSYTNQTGGDSSGLVRTGQYLTDLFQSGALTCLICIASVRRTQQVWSCSGCFSLFHLPCIQKWARDSAFLVSSITDEDFGQKQHPWPCPKCRTEYPPSATPNRYMCYCGKLQDPPADPWLVPHSCGSICQRELKPTCGHTCLLLCHPGPCPPCPKMVSVSCMCGKAKPLPRRCSNKAWSCQQRCGKLLSSHLLYEVSPRELRDMQTGGGEGVQVCARTLGCRNHKCPSVCHQGSCYPCPETVEVTCTCGFTVLTVPCGREKSTKPPRCKEPCRTPPSCHHQTRESHRCHPGPCPPCTQTCLLPLPGCSHTCPQPCHDLVLVRSQQVQLAGPWEQPSEPAFVQKAFPCPPCRVPIPTSCYGEHEVSPVPCHQQGRFSCGRACGRPLSCGNHCCSRECHLVTNGNECEVCEEGCSRPRPPDCPHPCPRPCHPGDCPTCTQMIRQRCHCRISTLYVECTKLSSADEQTKVLLGSCNNQCPRQLSCGHRCKQACHPGVCEEKCQQKVKVRCSCRRIKKEVLCSQSAQCDVQCDDICRDQQRKVSQLKEAEQRAAEEEEQRKLQEELEAFEKRQQRGGRRNKRRRRDEVDDERGGMGRCASFILVAVGGVLLSAAAYYFLTVA
uniref:Nuclear transcription factor, X-box binding-like 1 n=2 Tax=Nothobranchius TaxID=28779 RepID=A0A1A7ZVU2_NOTFU